jgi:hypothetical protein
MLSREENYLVCKSTGVRSSWEHFRLLFVMNVSGHIDASRRKAVLMANICVYTQQDATYRNKIRIDGAVGSC